MIRAVYGLPAICLGYMRAERRNNTHTQPITRQLRVAFLQADSVISVLSVFLFRVNQQQWKPETNALP